METEICVVLRVFSGKSMCLRVNKFDTVMNLADYAGFSCRTKNKFSFFVGQRKLERNISLALQGVNNGDTIMCMHETEPLNQTSNEKADNEVAKFNKSISDLLSLLIRNVDQYLTSIDAEKNAPQIYSQIMFNEERIEEKYEKLNSQSIKTVIPDVPSLSSKPLPLVMPEPKVISDLQENGISNPINFKISEMYEIIENGFNLF